MKKVMFLVVMLLVAGSCFAQLQSPPSNVTGYVKITALANAYTPFGLPFKFWVVPGGGIPTYGVVSTDPEDIVGDQTNCGNALSADLIWRQGGATAYRACTGTWFGTLHDNNDMIPGTAYWYRNRTAADRNLVLAGEVDNSGNYGTFSLVNGQYLPYSWRDSRNVATAQLNLLTSGFIGGTSSLTSDQVIRQGGGISWYRTSDATWQGPLTVEPGRAYWIFNRSNGGPASWVYNYNPGGALLNTVKAPSQDDNGGTISKMSNGPVKSSKGVSGSQK